MVTIRTMKDGLPHPKAQRQVITSRTVFASDEWCAQLYLNGSRLGVVFKPSDPADSRFSVVVWDWTTGELVLVCEFHCGWAARVDIDHPSHLAS